MTQQELPLTNVRETALTRGLTFLRAAGAEFHVRLDGKEFKSDGFEPAVKRRNRPPRSVMNNFVALTGYTDALKALKPGETWGLRRADCPPMADARTWNSFKSCVTGRAHDIFGKDNYVCAANQNEVQVLRVE